MQTLRSLRGPVTVVAVLLCLLAALLAGQQVASASPGNCPVLNRPIHQAIASLCNAPQVRDR